MTNGATELTKTVTVDLAFMSAQHMPNAWVFKPLDKTAHWNTIVLPKSQITYELTEPMNTIWTPAKVTLPEWLAKKTGLTSPSQDARPTIRQAAAAEKSERSTNQNMQQVLNMSEYDELLARLEGEYSQINEHDAAVAIRAQSKRIAELEAERDRAQKIIGAIDTALCNFLNNAEDPIPDVHIWSDSVRRDFKSLCDAYNAWHENHDIDGNSYWEKRAEAAESRLAAIDAYRGEAEKVAGGLLSGLAGTVSDAQCKTADKDEILTKVSYLEEELSSALLSARMEGEAAGRATEREACAKVCERTKTDRTGAYHEGGNAALKMAAKDIRARGLAEREI